MARCGCAGNTCSCVVTGAGAVSVSGAGSQTNPYVISGGSELQVQDSPTVDLTLIGIGSDTEPYILSAAAVLSLNELDDVDTTGGTTGQVLARQSDGTYHLVPPSTASPGSITVGQDLQGDGSGGNPLRAKLVAGGGLTTSASGLAVQGNGSWTPFTPTWTASTTNPSLGNGSLTGRYCRSLGKRIDFTIRLAFGSTTSRGVGQYRWALPSVPAAPAVYGVYLNTNSSGSYSGVGVSGDALTSRIDGILLNTSLRGENMTHAIPTSIAAGAILFISGTYEEV